MNKKLVYIVLLLPLFCFGQNNVFRFDHLTTQFDIVEDGLSGNTVLCLFQDSRGFLWIGTYSGLNRYDGYKVKVYKYDSEDEFSISNDGIRGICEDHDGNLWIGTNHGLNKFVRDKEKIYKIPSRRE